MSDNKSDTRLHSLVPNEQIDKWKALETKHEKLKEKVVEMACLRHIVQKGDAGSEEEEELEESLDDLEKLANGENPLPNLWPIDELNELKEKVRDIVRISKCTDGECSNDDYLKMWDELEELVK